MLNSFTETEIRIIISLISLSIGGISSYFIGRTVGKHNMRYQMFLNAASDFRETFVDMLIFLNPNRDKISLIDTLLGYNQDSSLKYIQHNISLQEKAFVKLSGYLKGSKLEDAKKAWQDYAYPNYKKGETNLSDSFQRIIAYKSRNSDDEIKIRNIIRNKINILLSYAPTK